MTLGPKLPAPVKKGGLNAMIAEMHRKLKQSSARPCNQNCPFPWRSRRFSRAASCASLSQVDAAWVDAFWPQELSAFGALATSRCVTRWTYHWTTSLEQASEASSHGITCNMTSLALASASLCFNLQPVLNLNCFHQNNAQHEAATSGIVRKTRSRSHLDQASANLLTDGLPPTSHKDRRTTEGPRKK